MSVDMLKKILGEDIKESPEEFQEWLTALSKEQLISEMLKSKETGAWRSEDESDGSDADSKQEAKVKEKGQKRNVGSKDHSGTSPDADTSTGAIGGWDEKPTTPMIVETSGTGGGEAPAPSGGWDW